MHFSDTNINNLQATSGSRFQVPEMSKIKNHFLKRASRSEPQ